MILRDCPTLLKARAELSITKLELWGIVGLNTYPGLYSCQDDMLEKLRDSCVLRHNVGGLRFFFLQEWRTSYLLIETCREEQCRVEEPDWSLNSLQSSRKCVNWSVLLNLGICYESLVFICSIASFFITRIPHSQSHWVKKKVLSQFV